MMVKNDHGATIRVCDECKQPVSGKRYGWGTCPRWGCHAEVCTTCRGTHERKHEKERAAA